MLRISTLSSEITSRSRWSATLRASIGLALGLLAACSCGKEGGAGPDDVDAILARDRAADAAFFEEWDLVREALEPLLDRSSPAAEDLLRAANAELADGKPDAAVPYIERAAALAPEDSVLLWCEFRVARIGGDDETALAKLERLRAKHPDDVPILLAFAMVLEDLERDPELVEAAYDAVLSAPEEELGTWRMAALWRMRGFLVKLGRMDDVAKVLAEFTKRDARGEKSPGEPAHQPGTLGEILPHTRSLFEPPTPVADASFVGARIADAAGARGARVVRLLRTSGASDHGAASGAHVDELFRWEASTAEYHTVVWGDFGVKLLTRAPSGKWTTERIVTDVPILDAIPFDRHDVGAAPASETVDLDRDQHLDLIVLVEDGLRLLENVGGEWTLRDASVGFPTIEATPADAGRIALVDYDHDGDVDVLACLSTGTRFLRNDFFDQDLLRLPDTARKDPPPAQLVEVTDLPFPDERVFGEPIDVDVDSDVDFLLYPDDGGALVLLDNERGGVFVNEPTTVLGLAGKWGCAADFDGDGMTDVATFAGGKVRITLDPATGSTRALDWPVANAPIGRPIAVDWDLDGTTDLLWAAAGVGVAGVLAPGFANGGVGFDLSTTLEAVSDTQAFVEVADLDGDFDQDLLFTQDGIVREVIREGAGTAIQLALTGLKDNARGIGAILEVRDGHTYRQVYWRGQDQLIGTGDDDPIDVLRVRWPNGVTQHLFDVPMNERYEIWQRPGLAGSCPFLYTWNGTTFEYVTDVLGITPLGLPMEPGKLVPPDHDEYVLVKGEQLVPKDGEYVLQFTEELREVTYLDRVRLDVIDHPEGTEVFPNERFTFPPFPEAHTHTVRDPLLPLAAVGSDGQDWADELRENDETFAAPFRALEGQFQGLATPHTLDLAFDAEAVKGARKLRLLLNGWLYWTDASVNVAAARNPNVAFVPPLLQVPDGHGGWRDTGPPIGFPAGKLKTMVVDVTDLLNRDDPRIRLFSTLRLYWDSIHLAVDDDDAETRVTELEPRAAELWERGFSKSVYTHEEFGLEWFEWDHLEEVPRWNQHPGAYTAYGETLPLVTSIDDRFVVMGAGDALTVRFDATQVPPLKEGWRRDFLVFLDGWAKDRDPNTAEALYVEPLPFHGMSGYPYGDDESFPDTEAHRDWLRDYQTRAPRQWIRTLVPEHRRLPARTDPRPSGRPTSAAYHEPDPGE